MSYLSEFLKNKSVGAVSSSSKSLGKYLFGNLDYSNAKVIVELGGGQGVFTYEILKLINPACKLLVFETNEAFCKKLKYTIQDDRAVIINDSAEKIGDYLEKHNFEKADHIISSLPCSGIIFSTFIPFPLHSDLKPPSFIINFNVFPYPA